MVPDATTAVTTTSSTSKPRGRNGPHPAPPVPTQPPTPTPPTSAMESIIALAAVSTTMMANHMMQSGFNTGLATQPASVPKRPLSPLPDVREELHLFMRSFGEFHGLSEETVESASTALKEKGYSPFVLQDKSLDIARIQELTGLNEGTVYGLRQFAGKWVEKQEAKRARLN